MDKNNNAVSSRFSIDKLSFYLFTAGLFLLPIFLIPVAGSSIPLSKYFLITVLAVVSLILWVLKRIKDGTFELPINIVFISALLVLALTLISTLTSGSFQSSFFGQGFETDTFIFLLISMVIMFLVPTIFTTKNRVFTFYLAIFAALAVTALFHGARFLFGPQFLSLGYLTTTTSNLFGGWNDLAIFFGLGTLLSLVSIELLTLSKAFKIAFYVALAVSLLFLAIFNFGLVWYALGAVSLLFFVYKVVINRSERQNNETAQISLPLISLIVFIISIIFIFGGSAISSFISDKLNINMVEVHPTLAATMDVARSTLFSRPSVASVFGVGPNRFSNEWFVYKPVSVNSSIYWNTSFDYGSGIIPSSLVTVGLLGFLGWALFLIAILYVGFRAILSKIADPLNRYLVVSTFLVTVYLWYFVTAYTPSTVNLTLAFVFTGLFVAALQQAQIFKVTTYQYFKKTYLDFTTVVVLIVLLIATLGFCYKVTSKALAAVYFERGQNLVNNNDLVNGQNYLIKTVQLEQNPKYVRGLAELYLLQLNDFLGKVDPKAITDSDKATFNTLSQKALQAASVAVNLDQTDFQSYLDLGNAWGTLIPVGIDKSYDNAVSAYQKALVLNPQNPYIYLGLARLETANNDLTKAKDNIDKAIGLKNNYTDAYLFWAQIQIAQGNVPNAIKSVAAALVASPNDPGLYLELGILEYNTKDYQSAASTLSQAIKLYPNYANAKYFLGLSLYELGKVADSITLFNDLKQGNPNSQEITSILTNLQAGKAPLASANATVSAVTAPSANDSATSTGTTKTKKTVK